MHAAMLVIAVGTLQTDALRVKALRADVWRAVDQFQRMLKSHEQRHFDQMTQLSSGSRARIQQIDKRIADLQREPDSARKSAHLIELNAARSYYERLAQYEPAQKK